MKIMKKIINRISPDIYKTFPEMVHPIHYPDGETEKSLLKYLSGFRLDSSDENELDGYLKQDFKRFVYTLNLLPEARKDASLLEVGANPYFTSILLKKFTDYRLSFINYFGEEHQNGKQVQKNSLIGDVFEFKYLNHNIEAADLPFDEKFDVILFCEVLEHLIEDPIQALLRLKKALKDDGLLILTTPNVNRLENIARMIAGTNIYDPYSGYGPYGRHNREYNKHELSLLLSHLGFEIETMFSSDVHTNHSNHFFPVKGFSKNVLSIKNRKLDLGQYIFVRARNSLPAETCKPRWLFRSYPSGELCDG